MLKNKYCVSNIKECRSRSRDPKLSSNNVKLMATMQDHGSWSIRDGSSTDALLYCWI